MCTLQRIIRRIMIESGLSPPQLIMALAAIVRQRAGVDIVIPMAILTVARCISPRCLGKVARCTGHGLMSTAKRIVRLCMIKRGLAQTENIRFPTFVIRVAAIALPGCR